MRNFFYIILFFNFFAFEVFAQNFRETSFDDRPVCERQNGVWRGFGNGCIDSCEAKLNSMLMCTQAITYGCDCGLKRCWNGKSCVDLADYKKTYEAAQEKEELALAKAKKARHEAYKDYQQSLLDKLASKASDVSNSAQNFVGDVADKGKQMIVGNNTAQQIQAQPSNITTQNQTQIQAQNQANSAPMDVEIPPYFLQKQKEEAAKKMAMDNLEGQALGTIAASGKNATAPGLPGLPEIPLP